MDKTASSSPFSLRLSPLPVAVAACILVLAAVLLTSAPRLDPVMRRALGVPAVAAAPLPQQPVVVITAQTRAFSPEVVVAAVGGSVTFVNRSSSSAVIRTATLSPAAFSVTLRPHTRATLRLDRPGLYHYYDAVTARPLHIVAGNAVIVPTSGAGTPAQGWIAVLTSVPGLREHLLVPSGQDLFQPKALSAIVGSTIMIANHDTDAHNFVIDPASPAAAAFVINGTDAEPPHGWQRALVMQEAGLYHVYCTLHTRVVGRQGGWNVVAPRSRASGYRDKNPMEAWILALPANTTP